MARGGCRRGRQGLCGWERDRWEDWYGRRVRVARGSGVRGYGGAGYGVVVHVVRVCYDKRPCARRSYASLHSWYLANANETHSISFCAPLLLPCPARIAAQLEADERRRVELSAAGSAHWAAAAAASSK